MSDELKEMGCSCHTMPPCNFCMELTEEEATILWNGSMKDLWKYWHEQVMNENQMVTIFDYERL